MARILFALALSFGFCSFAEEVLPPSMLEVDCAPLLQWFETAGPTGQDKLNLQAEVATYRQKTRELRKKQGVLARQTYAEGNRLFENILSMIAGGYDAGTIADAIADDVNPVFDSALRVSQIAKKIHDGGDLSTLQESFIEKSTQFGEKYSRYAMIMETLVSIAQEKGVSKVKTVRHIENAKTKDAQIIYDLRSDTAVATAKAVLKYLDRENSNKGLPIPTDAKDPAYVLYPSLQVVKQIFDSNLYAKLANAKWDYERQEYTSKPLVWIAHILSDIGVKLTGFAPEKWRPFARWATGLGNNDSVSARYVPDLQKLIGVTRGLNEEGNMVISTDTTLLNIQMKRLFDDNAKNGVGNDDEIVTLARLLWHEEVWINLMEEVARKAGAPANSKWSTKTADVASDDKKDKEKDSKDSSIKKPATTSGPVSRVYARRLEQMQKAEEMADRLGPLPMSAPRPIMVVARAGLVQAAELGAISASAYFTNWPWIYQHLIHPIASLQSLLGL